MIGAPSQLGSGRHADVRRAAATSVGAIDTVIVAFTDMQGRLLGKRLHRDFFFEEVDAGHGIGRAATTCWRSRWRWTRCPATRSRAGSTATATSTWSPTSRRCGGSRGSRRPRSSSATSRWHDGSPVQPSPRQVLRAQIERARPSASTPMVGSELEFYLLKETYEEAHAQHYRDLTPSVPYILDYHILATTYDEPFIRQIRNGMQARGDQRRDLEGRGVARPAGDQLPLRRRADDGRQPRRSTRTAPRRSRT